MNVCSNTECQVPIARGRSRSRADLPRRRPDHPFRSTCLLLFLPHGHSSSARGELSISTGASIWLTCPHFLRSPSTSSRFKPRKTACQRSTRCSLVVVVTLQKIFPSRDRLSTPSRLTSPSSMPTASRPTSEHTHKVKPSVCRPLITGLFALVTHSTSQSFCDRSSQHQHSTWLATLCSRPGGARDSRMPSRRSNTWKMSSWSLFRRPVVSICWGSLGCVCKGKARQHFLKSRGSRRRTGTANEA